MAKQTNQVNNARIPDIETLIQAGFDPKTGLPLKYETANDIKTAIKKILRIQDEQDAVNRYSWYNLPDSITQELIERILYYRGRGLFFWNSVLEEFDFLPCSPEGEVDRYGRYKTYHPLTFNGTNELELDAISYNIVYSIKTDKVTPEDFETSGVLLFDYVRQYSSNNVLTRQLLNDAILDVEAECIPYMRTNLIASTGVKGMRVNDQDQESEVKAAGKQVKNAALGGDVYVPIVGAIEFQDLNDGAVGKSSEFMLAMQSLDNFRLSTYGIENGGLFEKKAHELESENAVNMANSNLKYLDGLRIRQEFCHIVNSIWGLGIWCDQMQSPTGTSQMGMTNAEADAPDKGGNNDENDKKDSTVE